MRLTRLLTQPDRDVFADARFRAVTTANGIEYIVPQGWSRAATDLLIEQIFHKDALPPILSPVSEPGVPEWLCRQTPDLSADGVMDAFIFETDIRQVMRRMAGGWTYAAWKKRFFHHETDARIFFDEIQKILLLQMASPEIAQWQNVGLNWAYGQEEHYTPLHRIDSYDETTAPNGSGIYFGNGDKAFRRGMALDAHLAIHDNPVVTTLIIPFENTEALSLIEWRKKQDAASVATDLGLRTLTTAAHHIMDACDRSSVLGFDAQHNKELRKAIDDVKHAGIGEAVIDHALARTLAGDETVDFQPPQSTAAHLDIVVSISDEAIEAALTGHTVQLTENGKTVRHATASRLWDQTLDALWASGNPAFFFCDAAAPAIAQSAAGGFLYYPGSFAPSATLNISSMVNKGTLKPDIVAHATRLTTLALASLGGDAVMTGFSNLAAYLMGQGLAYDSDAARAEAAAIGGLITGAALQTSAEIAQATGQKALNGDAERDFLNRLKDKKAKLTGHHPIAAAARQYWEAAYALGRGTGFAHGHVTGIAAGDGAQTLLNIQTPGLRPEQTLARFESYFSDTLENAELYGKKMNPRVVEALQKLGYGAAHIDDIVFYVTGHGTLLDAPLINHDALKAKGFHRASLDALESSLRAAQHIRYAFNKWTLSEDFCRHILGFSLDALDDPAFDMLKALGFSDDDIDAANIYCCGTMMMEGAPHLKPEHLNIFDCLFPVNAASVRYVTPLAQITMQTSVEMFLSGSVGQTIELDRHTSIDALRHLVVKAWELKLKTLRLYRQNCSLQTPGRLAPEKQTQSAGTPTGALLLALPARAAS